jgi:hypothetical protein
MIISFSTILLAQDAPWTKDARNMIYNELLNELTIYKSLGQEQKESIALCGLEEITKKYPMTTYQAKIEVELKRIKSSTISQCSKNIGVNLEINSNEPVKPNVEWTKENKSVYYNEISNFLNKYENTLQEKEKISLCFVDELSKTYSKSELDNLIDAELKKVKNDLLKKCIELSGIKLKKQTENKLDKKSISGCWQSYDFTLCFFDNGDIEKRLDKGLFKKSRGKWFLETEKIILVMKDTKEEYKVVYFSGESLKLEEVNTKKELHFTKMFNF